MAFPFDHDLADNVVDAAKAIKAAADPEAAYQDIKR